jgi:hypothetical protein
MTTTRRTPVLVLAVALTALVAAVGYALANATDTGWATDETGTLLHKVDYSFEGGSD